MKKIALVLAVITAACAAPEGTTEQALTVAPAHACVDPAAYGAAPDDGVDDRPGIQAAIDYAASIGGGEVCLGAGTWDVTKSPIGTYDRFAAISWHSPNISLRGAGELATTIRMVGDGGAGKANVVSLDPGASWARVSDLAIDTSLTFNTDEQSHAIEVGTGVGSCATCPPVTDVTIQRVRINHPVIPGERKGDCVRVFGNYTNTEARNIKLLDLDLLACARSGIALQRNANYVTVSRVYFAGDNIGATMFDGEATGGGWDKGLIVEGCTFVRTLPGGDSMALALTSQTNYQIVGNTFVGRGLWLYRTTDGLVANNTIDATDALQGAGVIETGNVATRVSIVGNVVRRRGAGGSGIKMQPHSGGLPGPIVVADNVVLLENDSTCIFMHSPADVAITGNVCTGNGGPNSMGVYLAAISQQVDGVSITGNTFRNFGFAAVRMGAGAFGFSGVTISGNTSRASNYGLRCDGGTGSSSSVASSGNNWSTPSSCAYATGGML